MTDNRILELYYRGFSIDYIAKDYKRFINKGIKPLKTENGVYYPEKFITFSIARNHVYSVIYNNLIKRNKLFNCS